MGFAEKYALFLQRRRFIVLFVWAAIAASGGYAASLFLQRTTESFAAPHGTPSARARALFETDFPSYAGHPSEFFIAVESTNGSSATTDIVREFGNAVTAALAGYGNKVLVMDYFALKEEKLDLVAERLVAANGTAVGFPITFHAPFVSKEAQEFGRTLKGMMMSLSEQFFAPNSDGENYTAFLNGIPVMITEVLDAIKHDLTWMNIYILPAALAVMAFAIKSLRLVVMPLVTVGLSVASSFGIMYFATLVTSVSTSVPSMMMSLCMAMSIDYNLFLLSRYVTEIKCGKLGVEAIAAVLKTAGRTIFVSGLTLTVSFATLLAMPLLYLRVIGYGCGLAIVCSVATSLTTVPALLLVFEQFFQRSALPWTPSAELRRCRRCFSLMCSKKPRSNGDDEESSDDSDYVCEEEKFRYAAFGSAQQQGVKFLVGVNGGVGATDGSLLLRLDESSDPRLRSVFFKLRHLFRVPWNVIVLLVIVVAVGAVGYQGAQLHDTRAFRQLFPRNSAAMNNWIHLDELFGLGYTQPLRVLFRMKTNETILSADVFEYCQGYLRRLEALQPREFRVDVDGMAGVLAMGGRWMKYNPNVTACYPLPLWHCNINFFLYLSQTVSSARNSLYMELAPPVEPTGDDGVAFYHALLSEVTRHEQTNRSIAKKCGIYISGVGPESVDGTSLVYRLFPYLMVGSALAVLVIVGIAFGSVGVPLRSILSISLTEGFVMGAAVLVYQRPGILNWTGWSSVRSAGAVLWDVPVISFCVIIGVALDYDIFLLTRIWEAITEERLPTRHATVVGLCCTGKVITAAGVIMALAFFGLMLSSMTALNAFGFFLCVAVLFDTFIVRSLVVPCIMSLLGKYSWWPRKAD